MKGRFFSENKKFIIFLVLFVSANVLFAQSSGNYSIPSLKQGLGVILGFFSSGYMRAILSIALGGLALGLISNRGEPGVLKKFIPWIAACVILLSLSGITGILFSEGAEVVQPTSWN